MIYLIIIFNYIKGYNNNMTQIIIENGTKISMNSLFSQIKSYGN
jgi:hypothetical protein